MKYLLFLTLCTIQLNSAWADEKIGDWRFVDSIHGLHIANTTNSSSVTAGIICVTGSELCSTYISTSTECEIDGVYPMLINSSIGAYQVRATCTLIAEEKYLLFEEFQETRSAFESGGEVGFVLPLENGNFRVMRFSTKGATAAIKRAMTKIQRSNQPTGRDEYL